MSEPRPPAGSLADPDRLMALAATGLPETAADPALDRLTRLVQRCLNVPVALVSLVEADRQVFPSHQGLAEPWCSAGETPLSHSFCQYVVTREAPLVVADAREDSLVRDNGAVADLGVISYLGVPLRTPDGHTIGSLCAIDGSPRDWTDGDLEAMEALAEATMAAIAERYRSERAADRLDGALGRSRALFRMLFDAAPPALVLRPTGAVAAVNPAAEAVADLPEGAMLGLHAWAALPVDPSDEAALRDAAARAAAGETVPVPVTLDTAPSAPTVLRLRPVPDGDGLVLLEAA